MGWGGRGDPKTEQALFDANLCGQFVSAGPGFFKKAKDSTFDEPAVGPSTIATAPKSSNMSEDRLGRAARRGGGVS